MGLPAWLSSGPHGAGPAAGPRAGGAGAGPAAGQPLPLVLCPLLAARLGERPQLPHLLKHPIRIKHCECAGTFALPQDLQGRKVHVEQV